MQNCTFFLQNCTDFQYRYTFFTIVGHSFVNYAQFSRIPTVQYHELPCFFGIKPQKVAENRLTGEIYAIYDLFIYFSPLSFLFDLYISKYQIENV